MLCFLKSFLRFGLFFFDKKICYILENHIPKTIHYVVSHTIRTDSYPTEQGGIFNKHVLLIDNCASSGELDATYRSLCISL